MLAWHALPLIDKLKSMTPDKYPDTPWGWVNFEIAMTDTELPSFQQPSYNMKATQVKTRNSLNDIMKDMFDNHLAKLKKYYNENKKIDSGNIECVPLEMNMIFS